MYFRYTECNYGANSFVLEKNQALKFLYFKIYNITYVLSKKTFNTCYRGLVW